MHHALADAGATVSLMKGETARNLKLKLYPSDLEASGVNGAPINISWRVAAKVQVGKQTANQCFHVADDIGQDVLLGADFLEKLGDVTYNFSKCQFKVNGDVLPMGHNKTHSVNMVTTHTVKVISEIHIPPFTESAVIAEVSTPFNEKEFAYFEGDSSRGPRHVMFGRSLSVPSQRRIVVPVMNMSRSPQTIQINTVIGEAEGVGEDELLLTGLETSPTNEAKKRDRPGDGLDQSKTTLDDKQMDIFRELVNEFSDCIAETIAELGRTSLVKHVIETEPDAGPVRSRPYPIPQGLKAEVKKQIDQMLEKGMIEMASGHWSSPIVLIKKKDGSYRFCVDYRKLNRITKTQSMCLSSIESAMEIMHGKTYFSALDLAQGFFQVELHEDSREKSSFITEFGVYRFKVMSQGLKSSPATFARLSMAMMADLISSGSSVVYLDDWLLCSADFDSHMKLLRTVFERLRASGLKYRLSKSHFFQKQITYLGHIISREGIAVSPHNTDKVRDFPRPQSQKEVRRFLGMCGFYRTFVKAYSTIALPLTRLTGEQVDFIWTEECQEALEKLKIALTTAPVLVFPDFSVEFILTTDASGFAIGAVLSQKRESKDHPVAFYSKTLTEDERKWHSYHQELYAIVCSVKRFRGYLLNRHFLVQTDNVSSTYILKDAKLTGKLARWAILLAEYDFTVTHTPGRHNHVADALSRAKYPEETVNFLARPKEDVIYSVFAIETTKRTEEDEMMRYDQKKDFLLGPIIMYKEKAKFPQDSTKRQQKDIKKMSDSFVIQRGVLYKLGPRDRLLLAIPANQRSDLLFSVHDSLTAIHPGETKTMLKMYDQYWFPHMARTVRDYISRCGSCQRKKNPKVPVRMPLKNQYAEYPFHVLAVDFQGPLTQTKSGNKHILVWTDHFTKWTEMEATMDQLASTVAKSYINRIFCRFGAPKVLISDRAKNFLSDIVAEINKLMGVDHRKTTPYHPQTNGACEIRNKSIGNMLSHIVNERHDDWDDHLGFVQLAYNSSRHSVVNASPHMLLMGREPKLPHELLQPSTERPVPAGTYPAELQNRMTRIWEVAREAIEEGKTRQKSYYDKKANPNNLEVGDSVLYFNRRGYRNRTSKFIKRWQGIYVVKGLTETNARIQLFNDPEQEPFWVHRNNLKLYRGAVVRGSDVSLDFGSPDGSSDDDEEDDDGDEEDDNQDIDDIWHDGSDIPGMTADGTDNHYSTDNGADGSGDDGTKPRKADGMQSCSSAEPDELSSPSVGDAGAETPQPASERDGRPRRKRKQKRDDMYIYSTP